MPLAALVLDLGVGWSKRIGRYGMVNPVMVLAIFRDVGKEWGFMKRGGPGGA